MQSIYYILFYSLYLNYKHNEILKLDIKEIIKKNIKNEQLSFVRHLLKSRRYPILERRINVLYYSQNRCFTNSKMTRTL